MKPLPFFKSFFIVFLLLAHPSTSYPGGGSGGDATEFTQKLNNIELALQLADQLEQARNFFESKPLQAEDYIEQLAATLLNADQVSYMVEDVAVKFNKQLPDYDTISAYGTDQYTPEAISRRFKEWRDETREQLLATFERQGLQYSSLKDNERPGIANTIQSLLGLTSRNSLIKANGAITALVERQVESLRLTTLDIANMQQQRWLQEEEEEMFMRQYNNILFGANSTRNPVYGNEKSY